MALINPNKNPNDPDDYGYAVIRNISWDYGKQSVTVNVGKWRTREDRFSNIPPDEILPEARSCSIHIIAANFTERKDLYPLLLTMPEWSGWSSDE